MINLILCGGSGTRLWPISQKSKPKQFIKLFNDKSLFELCVQRNNALCSKQVIVSNAQQYLLAKEQIDALNIKEATYLLEPIGKNTAPAIALSCMSLNYDDIVLVTPSDHLIKDMNTYVAVVKKAQLLAEKNNLVTFGITPCYAETGYGYIESVNGDVKNFHEKPDKEMAQKYLDSGDFYWNSGIFCFKAGVYLDELKKYNPLIYNTSKVAYEKASKDEVIRIKHEDMQAIPEDSIDYAVMEKSDRVKMIESDISWSDLGSFESLDEELQKDENGNTYYEKLHTINAKHNFIYTKNKTVVLIDVDDLVIVENDDAIVISKKGSSQKIKEIYNEL